MEKYMIKEEDSNYIDLRITQTKSEIIKAILISILVPILFITLKTGFFKEDVNGVLIFSGIFTFILTLFTMVRMTMKRSDAFKKLVKEIMVDPDGTIRIVTAGGMSISDKIENFGLFEGYKGPERMKNIFDVESTYRLENFQRDFQFYLISSYFENWEELKSKLSGQHA